MIFPIVDLQNSVGCPAILEYLQAHEQSIGLSISDIRYKLAPPNKRPIYLHLVPFALRCKDKGSRLKIEMYGKITNH